MHGPLETLLADGVIEEICGRLKSGKEADLWLVRHGGETVAEKVYQARQTRSFRNNAAYKEGRQVRNTPTQRAMERGRRESVGPVRNGTTSGASPREFLAARVTSEGGWLDLKARRLAAVRRPTGQGQEGPAPPSRRTRLG